MKGIKASAKGAKKSDFYECISERFEKVYSQGMTNVTEIWVDKETGVNCVVHAGGMTPLLDRDGKPIISPIVNR